jgi:acetyl-CoA carboxylase carboxyltransferase component
MRVGAPTHVPQIFFVTGNAPGGSAARPAATWTDTRSSVLEHPATRVTLPCLTHDGIVAT